MSDTPAAQTIEFPCADYPIKIIGTAGEDFVALVAEILCAHVPGFNPQSLQLRPSAQGRFVSIQVRIYATGPAQLSALHQSLQATGRVHMVL